MRFISKRLNSSANIGSDDFGTEAFRPAFAHHLTF